MAATLRPLRHRTGSTSCSAGSTSSRRSSWIGTSFYFVALDNHLLPPEDERDRERGVGGESWEIHGGGFYRVEKFEVAPQHASGAAALVQVGGVLDVDLGLRPLRRPLLPQAHTHLIDPAVADSRRPRPSARASRCSRRVDRLRRPVPHASAGEASSRSRLVVLGLVTVAAYGVTQLYAPRAAYLQVGAMLGTIMVANVFFVIIPAHWELVRAKEAGREPDPAANVRGKQRSIHNNYLTLPVLFAMLAGHFPFTYGHAHSWRDPRLPDGDRRLDPALLQPASRRRDALVDPGHRRRRDRALAIWIRPASTPGRRRGARRVLRGPADRRAALRVLSFAAARRARVHDRAEGDPLRHAGGDRGSGGGDPGGRRRVAGHAAREPDAHDAMPNDASLGAWIRQGAKIP